MSCELFHKSNYSLTVYSFFLKNENEKSNMKKYLSADFHRGLHE